jgi:hypothetical protein
VEIDVGARHERPCLDLEAGCEAAAAAGARPGEIFRARRKLRGWGAEPPFCVASVRDERILGVVRDHEVWEWGVREDAGGVGAGDVEFYSSAGALSGEIVAIPCLRRRRLILRLGRRRLGCSDVFVRVIEVGLSLLWHQIRKDRKKAVVLFRDEN